MISALRALREVCHERSVRVVSGVMVILLTVSVAVGASVAAHAAGLAPETRETVLWLIGVASFGSSLLGAGASAVATMTMMRLQGASNAAAINEMRAELRAHLTVTTSLAREVSELRGYVDGREK